MVDCIVGASHGMYHLFPWSPPVRPENVLPGRANLLPAQQQRPSMNQIPLLNKMKRKRENSSPSPPFLQPAPKKMMSEAVDPAQITAPKSQRLPLPTLQPQTTTDHCMSKTHPPLDRHENLQIQNYSQNKSVNSSLPIQPSQQQHIQLQANNKTNKTCNMARSATSFVTTMSLRDTIEAQFGLEILLKHNELRLIDQEIAKCQTALEQLRRCQIIPYPALSSNFEEMQAASNGQYPSIDNKAPHAPPWGITNGPYSRHYDRWLIPDSAFDENFEEPLTPGLSSKMLPERSTRGSKSEKGLLASTSRSQRGSNNARLKALPHGYAEPKEEKGPMIVKRSSDGKMVKLVCLDCRRSNFNSAQGFINHCRIAHSRQFLSHDAAIQASGEEVEMDGEGSHIETGGSQAIASAGLVHPLIRSAHLLRTTSTEPPSESSSHNKLQSTEKTDQPLPEVHRITEAMSTHCHSNTEGSENHIDAVPFCPSPQTPHLSALFLRLGHGGDLNDLVTEATTKPEVDLSLSSDDEDEMIEDVAVESRVPDSRSTRGVLRGGDQPGRASKSPAPLRRSPIPSNLSSGPQRPVCLSDIPAQAYARAYPVNDDHQDDHHDDTILEHTLTPFNLSPNTIESHIAPSLVSDDGDYENMQSESETPSSAEGDEEDDHYIHAEVMDHDEMDLGEGSSANHHHHHQHHHIGLGGKPHGPTPVRRSRPPPNIHDGVSEERHVSFASPVRRIRRNSRPDEGNQN